MQIGFEQDSYTVPENAGSVNVCINMTTGNFIVPVTLAILEIASAQGMFCFQLCTSQTYAKCEPSLSYDCWSVHPHLPCMCTIIISLTLLPHDFTSSSQLWQLKQLRWLLCVGTMSSLAQFRV